MDSRYGPFAVQRLLACGFPECGAMACQWSKWVSQQKKILAISFCLWYWHVAYRIAMKGHRTQVRFIPGTTGDGGLFRPDGSVFRCQVHFFAATEEGAKKAVGESSQPVWWQCEKITETPSVTTLP
jgi:hypothetical protein